MREIAAAANVSVSTVSRVLSGDPAISESRAAEIRSIASAMNYGVKKKELRRSPAEIFHGMEISIISIGLSEDLLAVPTVAKAINGAEAALTEAGAHVLLRHIPDPATPPAGLKSRSIEGAVLFGPLQGNELGRNQTPLLKRLREVPSVWALGRPNGCWGDTVVPASFQTGARAADYLIARGHRELAFLNPKPDHQHFMQLEDGFICQSRRLGLGVRSYSRAPEGGWSLPLHAPTSVEAVQGLVEELLGSNPKPTAVLAAADSVAALMYSVMQSRGVRVGRDVSIISANNDQSLISGLNPGLTTFDVHARQIGRSAVQLLAARLAGLADGPELEMRIDSEIVERNSVATIA